uniref:Uncharacterized protein n=1 Tax=Caenorhabditis japonica TaxID=281687 RepID=A0A8R1IKT5_CAEJA
MEDAATLATRECRKLRERDGCFALSSLNLTPNACEIHFSIGATDGMIDASSEKCGRKTVLTIHFTLSFIAFLLCLLALISPSWHQVNLENGRTEHHHGLWLDCKRDYSFDYGRSRDYYETLYRRDLQGSPFSAF